MEVSKLSLLSSSGCSHGPMLWNLDVLYKAPKQPIKHWLVASWCFNNPYEHYLLTWWFHVISTRLKNISQIGSCPQVGVKKQKIFETTGKVDRTLLVLLDYCSLVPSNWVIHTSFTMGSWTKMHRKFTFGKFRAMKNHYKKNNTNRWAPLHEKSG